MRVLLHHPKCEVELKGPRRVRDVLKELKLLPETVLVIKGDMLATEDETVRDEDTIEIRPVISGG
jgi:sulfur carrier protein